MSDHDDKLSRRYHELARELPPPAIDAAILSAATRAVRSRPRRNWAVPVSLAAVLVLGIGVALRMQLEQPGIETSAPAREQYVPKAAPPSPAEVATQPSVPQAARERVAPPAPAPKRKIAPGQEPVAQDKAVAIPSRPAPAAGAAPEPRPFADAIAPASPPPPAVPAQNMAPAAAPATAPALAPVTPARAKSEGAAAGSTETRALMRSGVGDPAAELDRIARLRAEGRHAEADKALEEFQRRYPDFRSPEAEWARVKPR
ncbi:MAG: hypothetical protein ACXWF6_03175 [Usitatibacter sp.]